MSEQIDVEDIVKGRLRLERFDGLWNPEGECACSIDDLAPCGQINLDCKAGYKTDCPGKKTQEQRDAGEPYCHLEDHDCDWHIGPKPALKKDGESSKTDS